MNNARRALLQAFTRAYIEAALWSSNDESGDPLDANHSEADLSDDCSEAMCLDCEKFYFDNLEWIDAAKPKTGKDGQVYSPEEMAGHDFWLTRNGQGTGFWDRPEVYGEDGSEVLTKASKAKPFGEVHLYVGDDGRIYQS